MIREVAFDHEFITGIDPVWPRGVAFCHDVIEYGRDQYVHAYCDEDGPLWAMGLLENWDRVGSAWLLFDKRAPKRVFTVVREANRFLVELQAAGFRRIQGEIHEDAPTRRLAAFFGFETEGILRNYGRGGVGDYAMVARCFDGRT